MPNGIEGQKMFNIIVGVMVACVIADLFWVNLRILRPVEQGESQNNCDLACITNLVKEQVTKEFAKLAVSSGTKESVSDVRLCDRDCIEDIVNQEIAAIATPTPTPTTVKAKTSTQTVSTPKTTNPREEYLGLGTGTATGVAWQKVTSSEFWFDSARYGSNVSVTWQGWLETQNGIGFARLYDLTNNRAVDNSQVSVTGTSKSSFYSNELSIWRGLNQYQIEVMSTTGYPVTISTPRLKLVIK